MAYTIQDPAERAAFERWVDLTAQLIRKYGPALLEKLDAENQCGEYDAEQALCRANEMERFIAH